MDLLKMFSESAITLESFCDSISEGVVFYDAQKLMFHWNKTACQLLGTEPDTTQPHDWARRYQLYHLETGELLKYQELPMIKSLNGERYQNYLIMTKNPNYPDGAVLSVNGQPIWRDGIISAGLTTFRDVTLMLKWEAKLRKERKFFQEILDLMPGLVFIKDLEGKYLFSNKAFNDLVKAQSVVGRSTDDFLTKEMAQKIRAHDQEVLERNQAMTFEEVITFKDGSRCVFHSVRYPYRTNGSSEPKGICVVAQDITKLIDQRTQMEEQRDRSAHSRKLAALGVLSAEIAHEIKNPLTVLHTVAKMISVLVEDKEVNRSEVRKYVNKLQATIERIDKVSNSLNSMSKDARVENPRRIKVTELLEEVISLCSFRTKKLGIDISLGEACDSGLEVQGNRIQLSEVLMNLIINALDAIEGMASPRIWVECEEEQGFARIRIHDNGPGVPKELREKIFEPFFTTKGIEKGTGLGLSISRKIMDEHGGKLNYKSEKNDHYFELRLLLSSKV